MVSVIKGICPTGKVGIEMGKASMPLLAAVLRRQGAQTIDLDKATYGRPPAPMFVWFGTFDLTGVHVGKLAVPTDLHGIEVSRDGVRQVVGAGQSYFDPCCGKLEFVDAAIRHGAIAYGCELIPAKLALGLKSLSGRFEVKPVYLP